MRLIDKIGDWKLISSHEWNFCLPPDLIWAVSVYENAKTGEKKVCLEKLRA